MIPINEAIGCAPLTIGDLLDWPTRLYPSRAAIDGSIRLTFEELRDRAIQRALVLAEAGIGRFQRWGVIADNSSEFFISFFALARLGAVIAPLQPNQNWERVCSGANLAGVVVPEKLACDFSNGKSWPRQILAADGSFRILTTPELGKSPAQNRLIDVDPALLIWSSGSTRAARGVILQHRAVLANIRANVRALDLRDWDRTLLVLPVAHAYPLIHQCLCHLAVGATICYPPQPLLAPSLCRYLEDFEITTLVTVPPVLKILVQGLRQTGRRCVRLRLLTVGAGRADREALAEAMDRLPHARFAVTYGLTEAGPRVTTGFVERGNIDPACVGLPLSNVELRLQPVRGGAPELWIRGSSLMRSYADEPIEEGLDESFRTSDLAELHDGRLYIRGRADRAINRGGVIVAAEAVEDVLLRHPAIESVRVVAQPHAFWGEAPAALLSLKPDHIPPTVEELRQFCAALLSPAEIPQTFQVQSAPLEPSVKDQRMLGILGGHSGSPVAAATDQVAEEP